MLVDMKKSTLAGFTIGITADRRSEEQMDLFRRRGASVLHGPSIRTIPLGAEDELKLVTLALIEDPPDYLVANTGLGMRLWITAARSWGIEDELLDTLRSVRIVARGHKAATAAEDAGLVVWDRAADEQLDSVRDILLATDLSSARVAVQLHGADAPAFLASLRAVAASLVEIPVYEWRLPEEHGPALALIEAVIERRLDAITFTAAPAVQNLFAIAAEHDLEDALREACNSDVVVACVGPVCAEGARAAGIHTSLVPRRSRLGTMVLDLTNHLLTRDSPA